MDKINVNGKEYDMIDERKYGQNVSDQRKEILFHDPLENKSYLLMSYMEDSANTVSSTRLLTERNTICELTEKQVDSWKNGNFEPDREKLSLLEVIKEVIIS